MRDTHRFTYQLNAIEEKLWRFTLISFQSKTSGKFYILDPRMKKISNLWISIFWCYTSNTRARFRNRYASLHISFERNQRKISFFFFFSVPPMQLISFREKHWLHLVRKASAVINGTWRRDDGNGLSTISYVIQREKITSFVWKFPLLRACAQNVQRLSSSR